MTTAPATVTFIDLSDSASIYAALGKAQASSVISRIRNWIRRVCQAHGGRVIQFPGESVLASFGNGPQQAVQAALFMQRTHIERMQKWPEPLRMELKIGMACGPVIEADANTRGDAVHCAMHLAELAGCGEIWADQSLMTELRAAATPADHAVRYRALGLTSLRGMAQQRSVFCIDWVQQHDQQHDPQQEAEPPPPAVVDSAAPVLEQEAAAGGEQARIALAWFDAHRTLSASELPLTIGRLPGNDFVVSDQRVSRQHARIEWRDNAFVLTDLSSFGCWVRFTDSPGAEVHLQHSPYVLHSGGEISLGAPFSDFTGPVVAFDVRLGGDISAAPALVRSLYEAALG